MILFRLSNVIYDLNVNIYYLYQIASSVLIYRFPWESAYSGNEVTPDICVPCRENQQHITGDIAYAARQFVAATRDLDWLLSPDVKGGRTVAEEGRTGEEFLREMARFWFSRPSWNTTKERYEINGKKCIVYFSDISTASFRFTQVVLFSDNHYPSSHTHVQYTHI